MKTACRAAQVPSGMHIATARRTYVERLLRPTTGGGLAEPGAALAPVDARNDQLADQTLQRGDFEVTNSKYENVEVRIYEGMLVEIDVRLRGC